MIKTILLTGSGGFVGKNLKEHLNDKYKLLTPRSYELNLINSNETEKYFSENEIDFVIHCGSIGGYRNQKDKDTTLEDNLNMVLNILKYKNKSSRVILFGSGAMYDKSRPLIKVKENEIGKYFPIDLYGQSKLEISKIVNKRDDVICLNIFGCYGKHEKESRFPTYAIKQNLDKKPIEINQDVVFDYLYIDDLCKIIEYFIKNFPKEKIINVTPTKSISLYEITKIINDFSDYKSEITIKKEGYNNEYTGDNSLLLSIIPDFEFTPYEKGLRELYLSLKDEFLHQKI